MYNNQNYSEMDNIIIFFGLFIISLFILFGIAFRN
jgi:hypothetical protein